MKPVVRRYVVARENNVVRVDFRGEPESPDPNFPGAAGQRILPRETPTHIKAEVA